MCGSALFQSWHPLVWIKELPTTMPARLVLMRYGLDSHSLCLLGSPGSFPAIVLAALPLQLFILSAFTHCSHQLLLSPGCIVRRCIYPRVLLFRSAESSVELFAETSGKEHKNSSWVTGAGQVAVTLDIDTRSRLVLPLCSV